MGSHLGALKWGDFVTPASEVIGLLLMTGYLTARTQKLIDGYTHVELAIPNDDARSAFNEGARRLLGQGLVHGRTKDLLTVLLRGDAEGLEYVLSDLVGRTYRHRGSHWTRADQAYQALILGLLVVLREGWDVRSTRESDANYHGLLLTPRKPGQPGVSFELVILDDPKYGTVAQELEAALGRIGERKDVERLQAAGAEPIYQFALVYDGNELSVRKG